MIKKISESILIESAIESFKDSFFTISDDNDFNVSIKENIYARGVVDIQIRVDDHNKPFINNWDTERVSIDDIKKQSEYMIRTSKILDLISESITRSDVKLRDDDPIQINICPMVIILSIYLKESIMVNIPLKE